jgi:hypothetical protein
MLTTLESNRRIECARSGGLNALNAEVESLYCRIDARQMHVELVGAALKLFRGELLRMAESAPCRAIRFPTRLIAPAEVPRSTPRFADRIRWTFS